MRFEKELRSLALSFYWQKLYMSSRDINGINLFENTNNFSGFQVMFLYWLEVYNMLYKELGCKEWVNLDEAVIKDIDRCNAFLYWRQREQDKKLNEHHQELKQATSRTKRGLKGKNQAFKIFQGATNKGGS